MPQLLVLLMFSPFGLIIESTKGVGGVKKTKVTILITCTYGQGNGLGLKGSYLHLHEVFTSL
jgi:hypothetical protein